MAELNGRKWEMAFWIMTAIATVGLGGLASWVAANDIRAQESRAAITKDAAEERKEIRDCISAKFETIIRELVEVKTEVKAVKQQLRINSDSH